MKGERHKYADLKEDEEYIDFFKRHTHKEMYNMYKVAYTHLTEFAEIKGYEIDEIGDTEAIEFAKYMKSEASPEPNKFGQKIAELYISNLSQMFSWIVSETTYLDYEPFGNAVEQVNFEYDDRKSKKREIELPDLRRLIRGIIDPTLLLFVVMALKTGMRIGEIRNLQLRDIHIDHPINEYMPDPRTELEDLPDTLYVDSSYDGNKPKSYREIPIDEELKNLIGWYIAQRPAGSGSELIIALNGSSTSYTSVSIQNIEKWFKTWAKKEGLWTEAYNEKNLHPHWCRHWFTTTLRANINDDDVLIGTAKEYVQGLRGDTEGGVIETYTQEWKSLRSDDQPTYREVYEGAMPKLLVPPESGSDVDEKPWEEVEGVVPDRLFQNQP